jgi:chorismate synthase
VVVIEAVVGFVIARALLEKLGGDSLDEMRPRFEQLRSLTIASLHLSAEPKVFWPASP